MSEIKQRLLRTRLRQLARRDWRRRYAEVLARQPGLASPLDTAVEKEHHSFWRELRRNVMPDTLRVCANLSGRCDPLIVPEEVMVAEIEPRLNCYPEAMLQADKNMYQRLFPAAGFPISLLSSCGGIKYDRDGIPADHLNYDAVTYPVIAKTSRGPGGAHGVAVIDSAVTLQEWAAKKTDWLVQPLERQHKWMAAFSPSDALGVNTVRMCVYRSLASNRWVLLNAALRLGCSGTFDNEAAGGLACALNNDGSLNSYAVDKYAAKFEKHPDSEKEFSSAGVLPHWNDLCEAALILAGQTRLVRLISFDFFLDENGAWRPIEINLRGHSIRFEQYAGRPFFGKYTSEILEFCRNKQ